MQAYEIIEEMTNRKYSAIRKERDELNQRLIRILDQNEEYTNLHSKLRQEEFELAKSEYVGDEPETKAHKDNVRLYKKTLEDLRKDLLPKGPGKRIQYKCKFCHDTGYDKLTGKRCTCYLMSMNESLYEYFGLEKPKYNSFDRDSIPEENNLPKIYEKLGNYAFGFSKNSLNFLFSGKVGSGKTYLASCVADAIEKKGKLVLFLSSLQLNNIFIRIHVAPIEEKPEIMDMLVLPDLLVIDDLGTEPIYKNITKVYLLALIDERAKASKKNIITTFRYLKMI